MKGVAPLTGKERAVDDTSGACVPNHAPGLKFWDESAQSLCALGNAVCIVTTEKGYVGGEQVTNNSICLEKSWAENMNKVCMALGDCGGKVNFVGDEGYKDGYKVGNKSSDNSTTGSGSSTTTGTQTNTGTVGQTFTNSSGSVTANVIGFITKLFK
jgi:hypothetical protein